MSDKILDYADDFEYLIKDAIVRKMPNGKYRVMSGKKGKNGKRKNLGEYSSHEQAKKRLKQVEYFKWKDKHASADDTTYSAIMRDLNNSDDKTKAVEFQEIFKKLFDKEYLAGNEEPETIALEKTIELTSMEEKRILRKVAAAMDLGSPINVGRYLADWIKFILRRIKPENRQKAIDLMRKKIYYLNEYEISGKKLPAGSSYGQSITTVKHILFGHPANYVRSVLNSIVEHL